MSAWGGDGGGDGDDGGYSPNDNFPSSIAVIEGQEGGGADGGSTLTNDGGDGGKIEAIYRNPNQIDLELEVGEGGTGSGDQGDGEDGRAVIYRDPFIDE